MLGSRPRIANAEPSVTGPSRPMNMRAARVSWWFTASWAVMPVDRPTVAKADTTSNRIWSRVKGEDIAMAIVGATTITALITATVSASRTVSYTHLRAHE